MRIFRVHGKTRDFLSFFRSANSHCEFRMVRAVTRLAKFALRKKFSRFLIHSRSAKFACSGHNPCEIRIALRIRMVPRKRENSSAEEFLWYRKWSNQLGQKTNVLRVKFKTLWLL